MGKVIAVCRSEKKGTQKVNIQRAKFIPDFGMENDAHAGNWHRQVSLLSYNKVQEFQNQGAQVDHGSFGENLVVEGIDFKTLPIGTKLQCNDVLMEVTQIGKECHSHCQIYHKMGDCIMPREGIFVKILSEGIIEVGDHMDIIS